MDKSKLETFELVINVLMDHEKNLDNLLEKLETLIETLSTLVIRLEYVFEKLENPV